MSQSPKEDEAAGKSECSSDEKQPSTSTDIRAPVFRRMTPRRYSKAFSVQLREDLSDSTTTSDEEADNMPGAKWISSQKYRKQQSEYLQDAAGDESGSSNVQEKAESLWEQKRKAWRGSRYAVRDEPAEEEVQCPSPDPTDASKEDEPVADLPTRHERGAAAGDEPGVSGGKSVRFEKGYSSKEDSQEADPNKSLSAEHDDLLILGRRLRCAWCQKGFNRYSKLKKHESVHTKRHQISALCCVL